MNIAVVGATGVLGRNVVPRLVERGHTVRVLVRSPGQARNLRRVGIEAVVGDIFDTDRLYEATKGCDAALHLATAIPKSADQDWSLNDRVRREGTRNLIVAATANGVRRYVQQSIALLYGENGKAMADESTPIRPSETSRSAADMEAAVRASALDWCILRGGLFYGPGTGREDEWREAARHGRLALPGDGAGLISLIHVADMARAVAAAAEAAPAESVYNIVDDEPTSFADLFGFVSAGIGADVPKAGGPRFLPSLACSNAKAKRELPWRPAYPSYRSGLA